MDEAIIGNAIGETRKSAVRVGILRYLDKNSPKTENHEPFHTLEEVPLTKIHQLTLEEKAKRVHWAGKNDYRQANGEKNLWVYKLGNMYFIVHVFDQEAVVVPTSISFIKKSKTLSLRNFPGKTFAASLLKELHGDPCDKRTRRYGGNDTYPHIQLSKNI